MQKKWIFRRSLIITIVLMLLAVSFFPTSIVSSSYVMNEGDGTWMDTFDDDSGILKSKSKNQDVSNGYVMIDTGIKTIPYDFSANRSGINDRAYARSIWFRANILGLNQTLQDLIGPESWVGQWFENQFNEEKYEGIEKEGDGKYACTSKESGNTVLQHFIFEIKQPKINIDEIEIGWRGHIGEIEAAETYLYVWNHSYTKLAGFINGKWDEADSGSVDNFDTPLFFETTDKDDYIDEDGYIHILVVATGQLLSDLSLYSDYVYIDVTATVYNNEASVTSIGVHPENLSHWGFFVWDDLKLSSSKTTIKYHVRYNDDMGNPPELIPDDDLPGNEQGFTTSPVDLSELEDTIIYNNLSLYANLTTTDDSITPRICRWGVTWQTKSNKWRDDFSTDLRIDKFENTIVENDGVNISDVDTNWPFFGGDLVNTRFSQGHGPKTSDNVMWKTTVDIAGGFSSPAIVDGVIYIGSNKEKKIRALAAITDNSRGEKLGITSEAVGKFDVTPAVTDTMVIAGTGTTETLQTIGRAVKNKIYAYDKANLSQQSWEYTYGGADSICFSGSPVVHDGRIFITSWSGVTSLEAINEILAGVSPNENTESNNLFALNEITGRSVWGPFKLPGPSLCTPAVHDGVVYVGCENTNGSNLFAIDETSGSKIWGINVGGMIGRTAPVIYDGKIFVVFMKNVGSFQWTTHVAAVYLSNQTIAWETQIGDAVSTTKLPTDVVPMLGHLEVASTSPAVHDKVIFVTSTSGTVSALNTTDGEEKWSKSLGEKIYSSPVVADGVVYVVIHGKKIFALNEEDGEEAWNPYQTDSKIFSSPVVVDGVLYVADNSGVVYAIGSEKHKYNTEGIVYSRLIKPPTGMWWNKFYAGVDLKSGEVEYNILNENYNPIMEDISKADDISSLKTNKIHLCAKLARNSQSQNPCLLDWSVTFKDEIDLPGGWTDMQPEGWTNVATPTVSIQVEDNTSGLDNASAQYAVSYSIVPIGNTTWDEITLAMGILIANNPNLFEKIDAITHPLFPLITIYHLYTPWENAYCECSEDLKTGFIIAENVPITEDKLRNILPMDTFEDYFGEYDTDYALSVNGIEFSVSDLAGNQGYSGTYEIDIDITDPVSFLLETGWYKDTPVDLTAYSEDGESGVAGIWLYYRYSENNQSWSENWTLYDGAVEIEDIWSWSFDPTEGDGFYELYTEAVDNAGNEENISEDNIVLLIIDTGLPAIPEYPDTHWFNEAAPIITFSFSDNIMLKEAYYKVGKTGEYKLIEEDIGKQTVNLTLSLEDEWESFTAGNKSHLYFKVTDYAGNVYETADTERFMIVKDIHPPYSQVDQIHTTWYYLVPFTVIAGTYDDDSPIKNVTLYYRWSNDNETWGNWTIFGINEQSPFKWSFDAPKGSGYYEFYSLAVDSAGNPEEMPVAGTSADASVGVNIIQIILVTLVIILGALGIIIAVVSSIKFRSKRLKK